MIVMRRAVRGQQSFGLLHFKRYILSSWFLAVSLCLSFLLNEAHADSVQYFYDPAGRLVGVADPVNGNAQYIYDSTGNILSVSRTSAGALFVGQIAPSSATAGTLVTIGGAGFGTASTTTISFNGVLATPASVTSTAITVRVPNGASSGPVTVKVQGVSANSISSFTVLGSAPSITSITPATLDQGGTVTISGTGFDPVAVNNKVTVNGRYAAVLSATATSIKALVPILSSAGPVVVATPAGSVQSTAVLTIPPLPYVATQVASVVRSSLGSSASVSTTSSGQVGIIAFHGNPGQRFSMFLTAAIAGNDTVSLYGPDGTLVEQQTGMGAGGYFNIINLTQSGDYLVTVASSGAETATISLLSVPPDVVGTISANATAVSLTTTSALQNMKLTFAGVAGQRVSLLGQYASPLNNICCGSTLTITGPDSKTQIYNASVSYTSQTFSGVLVLPTTGSYTIYYSPTGNYAGTATFTLTTVPPDVISTISETGPAVSLTTTVGGQNMGLTFNGNAGQRISLTGQYSAPLNNICCGSTITITAPDGKTQIYSSSVSYTSTTFSGVLVLPTTGVYSIYYIPTSIYVGTATFTLQIVPPDVSGSISANGSPVSLTTTVAGQNMRLTFSGTAGQHIGLVGQYASPLNNLCCGSTLTITEPDGKTQLYTVNVNDTSETFTGVLVLPTTGNYSIYYTPTWTYVGTATFTLNTVPPDVSATIAANSSPVSLTTTVPGQNMSLTFSGSAGQRVTLSGQYGSPLNSLCCGSILTITEPDGITQLYSINVNDTSQTFSDVLILPVSGTYKIYYSPTWAYIGTATFTLTTLPADANATITAGGGAVALTTTVPGQNMILNFSGTVGQRISLFTTYTYGLNGCCSTTLAINNPDGKTQLYSANIELTMSSFTDLLALPATGVYTIYYNPQSTDIGTATFALYNVPSDLTGKVTVGGSVANYSVTAPGQSINIGFTGSSNQSVTVNVSASSISPSGGCYNITTIQPDGKTVLRADQSCGSIYSSGSLILPSTGTYTVVVHPVNAAVGSFGIGVATP